MKSNHIILAAVAALIIGGLGFYGGTIYAKSAPRTAQAGARGNAQFGQFAGRQGGAGGTRANMMGGFTSGNIVSADDKGITLEMQGGPDGASGGSKIVLTSDSTKVYKMMEVSKTDLTKDTSVTVMGTANQDGSITAQNIQIRPEGMAMPMMFGAGRGQAGNGGQPPAQQ
jgi:hypothetical protein